MEQPLVIVVILNTNRRDDTLECLASLAQSTYSNYEIIVLDNHSSDGSVQAIGDAWPEVEILALSENRGYAGNNNVGIKAALGQGADWVFVLNEDTVVDPDCLAELVRVGERDEGIGIVGPMVYHHSEPTVIQSAGGKFGPYWDSIHIARDEPDLGELREPHAVDWISGCGILVRRKVVEQVGMIDERYFYFWEETEWCLRAGKGRWQVVHAPRAKMWHKGVARDHKPKPSVTYYATRNRLLTLSKHQAPPLVWAHVWAGMLRTLTSWTIKTKWRPMRQHRNAMWQGIMDFMRRRWGPRKCQHRE